MKKIINNKVYDTEKAAKVGEDSENYPSDFSYVEEVLYRKRTGEYFLYGYGPAASRSAERVGSSGWGSGERIMPLSYEQARQWAEDHMEADDYMAEFEVDPEEGGSVTVTLVVPSRTKALLDREAARSGRTRSEVAAEAIEALAASREA